MKIDFVLTSCNDNAYYLNLDSYVFKVWKQKFNLDLYLILISNSIPDKLLEYSKYIILFKPIENMNTCYIAQVIRILYPSLFENSNILITDIDIIPISLNYFIKNIESYDNSKFIAYTNRYLKNNMVAICYNIANSSIWKKIFNIGSIDEVISILKQNYNPDYIGTKNCPGWYSDQVILYNYLIII